MYLLLWWSWVIQVVLAVATLLAGAALFMLFQRWLFPQLRSRLSWLQQPKPKRKRRLQHYLHHHHQPGKLLPKSLRFSVRHHHLHRYLTRSRLFRLRLERLRQLPNLLQHTRRPVSLAELLNRPSAPRLSSATSERFLSERVERIGRARGVK